MSGNICPGCQQIVFRKNAVKCPHCGSPMRFNPILVSYTPEGARVNQMIAELNKMVDTMTPQDYAAFVASGIAAYAYMMLEMNSPATIKEVFGIIIDDAAAQRKTRVKKVSN